MSADWINGIPHSRDAYFVNHIHRSTKLHASASSLPVYYYQFSYSGNFGVEREPGVQKTGAAHSDELAYLYPEDGSDLEREDGVVQEKLVHLWTNFVKYLLVDLYFEYGLMSCGFHIIIRRCCSKHQNILFLLQCE